MPVPLLVLEADTCAYSLLRDGHASLRKNKIDIAKCTKISIFRRGGCPHPPVKRLICATSRADAGICPYIVCAICQLSNCFTQFECALLLLRFDGCSVKDCKTGSTVCTGQAYRIKACHRHCDISCTICALMAHGG